MKKALIAAGLTYSALLATDLSASGLWLEEGFEDYPNNTSFNAIDGFSTGSQSLVTDSKAFAGSKSIVTFIEQGQDGWGKWGYEVILPQGLGPGSEIWWQQAQFIPENFDRSATGGGLKWFRICRVTLLGGDNRGCLDTLFHHNPRYTSGLEYNEGDWDEAGHWVDHGIDSTSIKGRWEVYENYMRLGVENGLYRLWKNGRLVGEINRRTMSDDPERLLRVLMSTYWNGNAPATQGVLIDEVRIALRGGGHDNTGALRTDPHGNLYIGLEDGGSPPTEPPQCPDCPSNPLPSTKIEIGETVVIDSELPVETR